jgi:predicted  nucleic acid-binding Zn-ribbon protein
MSESLEFLLTEEFQVFSQKIKEIFDRKKSKQDELKQIYDKIKVELKAIDDEAKALQQEWEAFKASKGTTE